MMAVESPTFSPSSWSTGKVLCLPRVSAIAISM